MMDESEFLKWNKKRNVSYGILRLVVEFTLLITHLLTIYHQFRGTSDYTFKVECISK